LSSIAGLNPRVRSQLEEEQHDTNLQLSIARTGRKQDTIEKNITGIIIPMPQGLHNEVLHSKQLSHLRDQCQFRETISDHRDRVFPPRTRRDSESLHRL
jgi:hypothetical protein